MLRQLRAAAGLTQEELAEAAGLSPRSVSDLERGIHRTAHKDTAVLLAGALGLAEPDRALFVAAARGYRPAAAELAAQQRAARLTPRSRSLTDRVDRPAASASSSWVSPAPDRSCRSRSANPTAGDSAMIGIPSAGPHPATRHPGPGAEDPPQD